MLGSINLKKTILVLLCIKLLILDSLSLSAFAEVNLLKSISNPVSYSTSLLPDPISVTSDPVSLTLSGIRNHISLSSDPVSFKTDLLPTTIFASSLPVSYLTLMQANLITLNSNPVSYSISEFTGEKVVALSEPVSYKAYNGTPYLSKISPNVLPIKSDLNTYRIKLIGENFSKDAIVSIGTLEIDSEYISSREIVAIIPANFTNMENIFQIFVTNLTPGGSVSEGLNVSVVDPVPTVKIVANPSIGIAPQVITFDGRESEDILASFFGTMTTYLWNFGDNNSDNENPNVLDDPVVTHKYDIPGKYQVMLSVTNSYGMTSYLTREIEVRDKNDPPDGTISSSASGEDVPLAVSFNSMIIDPEGDSISYLWDFGDGKTSSEINPVHTYEIPGTYAPKLTVTDLAGGKTTLTTSAIKALLPNNIPNIQSSAVPVNSVLKQKSNGQFVGVIQFTSDGTYDPDGETLTYLWDFGDGETSIEKNPRHEYLMSGNYNVKLIVSDERNAKVENLLSVSVLKPAPLPIANVNQTSGIAPLEIIFDGMSSSDYDGAPVSLRWDFGDGDSQVVNSLSDPIKHIYQNPGVYLVTLTVSATDNRFKRINLGNVIVNNSNAPVGQIVKLEGNEKGILGTAMIKLSAMGSSDPAGGMISYKWSWSARSWDVLGNVIDISSTLNEQIMMSNLNYTGEEFEYTFNNIGQFTPVLEIEKEDGSKFNFYGETYTILEDQAPIAIAKLLNEDTSISPNTEITFDGSDSYDPKGDGIMSFLWDFGDGTMSSEISPKHIYSTEGTFTPNLIVLGNDGKIGYAQTQSIKVQAVHDITAPENLSSRKILLQAADNVSEDEEAVLEEDSEKNKESVETMITDVITSYDSSDNEKPEIGPVTLEPKSVEQGGALKLSAFVKDNIGLANFGYVVLSSDGMAISHKIIDLINKNIKGDVNNEFYIEEKVDIPVDVIPGTYKIKFTATDSSGNQLAKISSSSNEEVSATFEVKKSESGITKYDILIAPSEVFELTDTNIQARVSKTCSKVKGKASKMRCERKDKKKFNLVTKNSAGKKYEITKLENDYGLHIRKRDYLSADSVEELEAVIKTRFNLSNSKNIKALATGFNVSSLTAVTNPWVYSGPTSTNSLTLDVVPNTSMQGYLEIGAMGSLTSTYFSNWWKTLVYVDGNKIGTIPWNNASGISYTGTKQNVPVEFRPANNNGTALNSATWTMTYINFIPPVKPEITSLSPVSSIAGRGSFDLYLNGTNFNTSSKVYFNGNSIIPYISNSTLLVAKIPADYVKDSGSKNITVKNSDGQESSVKTFDVKVNPNNPCNIQSSLPQAHYGADSWTVLGGNNTYLSLPNAVIESAGSVTIPFCLDNSYDVKITVSTSHTQASSSTTNNATFWLDGIYIGQGVYSGNTSQLIDNLTVKSLTNSSHTLEIRFSGLQGDRLSVGEIKLLNASGPVLDNFEPKSIGQEGAGRVVTITGRNFNQDVVPAIDGIALTKTNVTSTEIKALFPDKFSSPGQKGLSLSGNGKVSRVLYLNVLNKPEIVSNSFQVNPIQPFPGTNFNLNLSVSDTLNESSNYTAELGVFDPDGKLLVIPNISNLYSTIQVNGLRNPSGITPLSVTVPLSVYAKQGNYKTVGSVKRDSSLGSDYSSVDAVSYLAGKGLGLILDDTNVPSSHKLTFTPKPGVDLTVGIDENDVYNQGFNSAMTKVIQSDQDVKLKVVINQGQEYSSMLKYNFISGDGRASGLTPQDSYSFRYSNSNLNATTPTTFNTNIEVYWIDNGIQSKIRDISGPSILVYPNYAPVAKARVLKEQYPVFADKLPLSTAFIDTGSYDPNQKFSAVLDSVDSMNNIWELYKITTGTDGMIYTSAQTMLSSDMKTIQADFTERGSYFAKLTVRDKTGLSDSASTESVTVAGVGQRVGVFASTDPGDKKVYDPSTSTSQGLPVMFKSSIFGNYKSVSYKWDFGDGSCSGSNLNSDCTDPNPIHYYFDGKKSFGGTKFNSRKSVTPKLIISAMFGDGSSEEWSASAGTITFNTEPQFVLIDLKPEVNSGIVPFTVNLMIDPLTAKIVNATPTKYELDWGDGSSIETGVIARSVATKQSPDEITFDELKSKIFTHIYTTAETYNPKLKVYIKETTKVFEFSTADIVVGARGTAGVYVLDDLSSTQFTNDPIITFMVNTVFANPSDLNNRLKIKVKDNQSIENITELNPNSDSQTISLSEGKNSYYFESTDSSSQTLMTEEKNIVLDTVLPAISNIHFLNNNNDVIVSGNITEENLQKVEIGVDGNTPIILSSEELKLTNNETNEFEFRKTLNNLSNGEHNLIITAYDLAGNISEENSGIRKQNNSTISIRKIVENGVTYVTNASNNLYNPEIFETNDDLIAGNSFKIQLQTCFSDDQNMQSGGVEANLDIESLKLKEIKQNGITVPKGESELDEILNSIKEQITLGCADLGTIPGLLNPSCTDSAKTACLNKCVHFDNFACGYEIFKSKFLNNPGIGNRFSFTSQEKDPTKPWDIGTYELNFEVNENPVSCSTYGTCLGKNPGNRIISQRYKYAVNVKRDPKIEVSSFKNTVTKDSGSKTLSTKSLLYNAVNKLEFDLVVIDNVPFTSGSRIPTLDLNSKIWTNLGSVNPQITVQSEQVDSTDPGKYIFKLLTTVNPKTPNRLSLSIPVKLPGDFFNPSGIDKTAYIELPVITNIPAEIILPNEGAIITDSIHVSSKVSKPSELEEELSELISCKKNEIFYGVKFANDEKWLTLQKITPQNINEKIASKGITQSDGSIKYENSLNFNLKNNKIFTKGFLDGTLFGPIDLSGEYSTACNSIPIFYTGNPKKYILLDNPKIVKSKCNRIKDTDKSLCEIVVSNNTTNDDLEVEITPDNGVIDKTKCNWGRIYFENAKNLSKKLKVSCLPGNASKFTIKLKRSSKFLDEVKNKLANTSLANVSLDSKLIADSNDSFVNGEVSEEEEDSEGLFKVGDPESKVASIDGKIISVGELNDLFLTLGYLSSPQNAYTIDTRDAFARLICDINSTALGINTLKAQTTLQGNCSVDVHPEFVADENNIRKVLEIQQFLQGLIESNLELYNYIKNNPVASVFIIPLSAFAGTITTITGGVTKTIITLIFTAFGVAATASQAIEVFNRVQDKTINGPYYLTGYITGEVIKIVGIATIANFAFKSGEILGTSYKVSQTAEIALSRGLNELYITLIGQLNRLNKADLSQKDFIKSGLDRFLITLNDLEKLEIFRDYVKLWNIQDINYVFSLRSYSYDLLNTVCSKLNNKDIIVNFFFKDTDGYQTQVLKNCLFDQNLKDSAISKGFNLSDDLASSISEVALDTTSSINQSLQTKGYKLIGRNVPAPTELSTVMKISDLKFYLNSKFIMSSPEELLEAINSGEISINSFSGNLSTNSGVRWWTYKSTIENLRSQGKLNRNYINSDDGLALGIKENEPFVIITIRTSNLSPDTFHIPISSEGSNKFVPSNTHSDFGRTLGGKEEIITPPIPADPFSNNVINLELLN